MKTQYPRLLSAGRPHDTSRRQVGATGGLMTAGPRIKLPDHPIMCRQVRDSDELAACMAIRRKIFVDEQKIFSESDCDGHDAAAIHLAAFCKGRIVGTVRVYRDRAGMWWGGRLAVTRSFRGRAGKLLVRKAVQTVQGLGGTVFYAYVQTRNVAFFETLGWETDGPEIDYHGRPHRRMKADLSR